MSEKRLLREWYRLDYKPELLKEFRDKNAGKLIFPALLQKSDTKNQNKRVYPDKVLKREVENYMKAVREGRAVGELDHPESSTVSLKNASHCIRDLTWNGKDVMGMVEVLNTPSGKIMQDLLQAGIALGMSSRGVGSTSKKRDRDDDGENEEVDEVNDDYQIICWDCVSEPSTPGAFLFKEGRSIDLDPRRTWRRADRIYRALNEIVRK